MAEIKNTKRNIYKLIILVVAIFGLAFFNFRSGKAEVFDCDSYLKNNSAVNNDCDQLDGDEKDKCEVMDKQIKDRCALVEIKSKQANTLQNQMILINAELEKNRIQLQQTQTKADSLAQQIENLNQEIQYKENLIKYQQIILTGLIQSYYEDNQEGMLKIVLINKDFSEILNQSDYVSQTSNRVNEVLKTIQDAKAELQKEQDDLQQKKTESDQLEQELSERKNNLQASEIQKKTLLTQTQGEEQKYQQLLARVEQQKLELFNFGSASNLDDIISSVNDYSKPKNHLASTSWYFSQRDSRWGSKSIGNSNSSMEDYGCAVTSVSMVFKFNGANINPGTMAKQKIFYYDLIKWPGSWSPDIKLISSISHGNINWKKIDSEISDGHPVIVFIKKTNGRGGHYVVVHNKDSKDYIVHDPYFGANLYLGTSKALVGKLGTDSGTKVDQMIIYN